MHNVLEDVQVCLALFLSIGTAIILFINVHKPSPLIYKYTVCLEALICLPLMLLETQRPYRRSLRSLGIVSAASTCFRGPVFAFGFHYLWNYSPSLGAFLANGVDKQATETQLMENLAYCCFIAIGTCSMSCVKKHAFLLKRRKSSLLW
eukprot:Gregarina_sp_Poly_1__701@NODE_1167_length_4875_cov_37_248128_g800_i0_p2_GENE_NODE_1167_length_4875_cov_37_248128_g800_i0NODE_1167_length_4875_cov_37_248128_g800_i0_p2_ORF_typecomplete_len149_score6_54DUF2417/PF10329_9/0_0064DUF2101/PF09874_9/0_076DUF2101/PF09874_9/2_9e02_NODE_1167_length_4875_cov_37_248128_g800_i097543